MWIDADLDPPQGQPPVEGRAEPDAAYGRVRSTSELSGPRRERDALPSDQQVIGESHTDKQSTLVVRTDKAILDPAWKVERLDLEDLVLAYMTRAVERDRRPKLEVRS
jgi:ABC-2 type transport system ATP-binding protein